jgi:hypothetical protein
MTSVRLVPLAERVQRSALIAKCRLVRRWVTERRTTKVIPQPAGIRTGPGCGIQIWYELVVTEVIAVRQVQRGAACAPCRVGDRIVVEGWTRAINSIGPNFAIGRPPGATSASTEDDQDTSAEPVAEADLYFFEGVSVKAAPAAALGPAPRLCGSFTVQYAPSLPATELADVQKHLK